MEAKTGTQGRNVTPRPQRNIAYWLVPRVMFTYLSHVAKANPAVDGAALSGWSLLCLSDQ